MVASRMRRLTIFFEAVESAADDEEDVFGVDCVAGFFAAHLAFEHGLDLPGEVLLAARGDVGFLHELEEVGLDAAARDVAGGVTDSAGDLIDFVDVNNSVLGALHITIGAPDQFANEIFNIAANVSGFGEFSGVAFNEGNADEVGDAPNQVGFTDTGRADENDVLFCVVGLVLAFHGEATVVVMIAHGHGQDLLGVILFNDEAVEVIFDVAGFFIEAKLAGFFGSGGGGRFGAIGAGLGAEEGGGVWEMLAHEIGHLALKILR